jgi:GT2 family glycosyltransferase
MHLSVVIPCYNGAPYLGNCIQAVLRQSCAPDEVIVVDDGSTDASAAVAADHPIRLLRHPSNQGLAVGRNTALAAAQGDIIVYVDVDAYAAPDMVAALSAALADSALGGAGGRGIEAVQETVYDRWRGLHASQGYGERPRERCPYLFGLCMAYRRAALLAIGGFDTSFRTNAEDVDVGLRLNKAGYPLRYVPEAVVFHQRRDDHASLRRAMYQWYYWAFIAKAKNGAHPWTLGVGTWRRLLWSDTWPDLIMRRDPALVKLDVELAAVKMQAVLAATRSMRKRVQ